jgi:sugar lactone lactonase YvrE
MAVRHVRVLCGLLLLLVGMPLSALAARDLSQKHYSSPSAHWVLTVDPEERTGAGSARYVLMREGKQAWSARHPFTLQDAVVADDGTVGGYAYSAGFANDRGDFIVAVIDPSGVVRGIEKAPRGLGRIYLHAMSDPKATGLFFDADNDRMVVRVSDPDGEEEVWWSYRLSDGQALTKIKPKLQLPASAQAEQLYAVRPLLGTPLTLLQWQRSDERGEGAHFSLIEADGKPVWGLNLSGDYELAAGEKAEVHLLHEMRTQGAILSTTRPARFELRHVAAGQRVSYAVERNEQAKGAWSVREIARAPFVPTRAQAATPTSSTGMRALRKLGVIPLVTADATVPSIGRIGEFALGEGGRLAFVTGCGCEDDHGHAFVLVGDKGQVLRTIALPEPAAGSSEGGGISDRLAWIEGDRWLVVSSRYGMGEKSSAWWVDAASGELKPIAGFDMPSINALASTRDGGFAALATEHSRYSMRDTLVVFDAEGKRRWEVTENSSDETKLSSAEDIAVTSAGEVVVLNNIRDALQFYGLDGTYHRTLKLAVAWGREPSYPSGLEADSAGGLIVHDFTGSPAIVRMTADGSVTGQFTPHFSNLQRFDIRGNVQAAPDGSLWTSDGHALLQLDAAGKVEHVVGPKPDAASLDRIAALAVDRKGSIHAADERTGAIHVFDRNGKPLHVCRPQMNDHDGELSLPSLTVADSGDVYIERNDLGTGPDEYLHYRPDGARAGIVSIKLDEVSQDWVAQPGGTNRWILGYENVYLVDAAGSILRRSERTADRQWWASPGPASVAADGAIAIVNGVSHENLDSSVPTLTILSRSGDAVATWPTPSSLVSLDGGVAFDGRQVAFLVSAERWKPPTSVQVFDPRGKLRFRFEPGHASAAVFLVPGDEATELWLFDGEATLHRYAMP